MTYGKTSGCFENILVEKAGDELLWEWRTSDAENFEAVKLVVRWMVKNTETRDDVIVLPCAHQGQLKLN